jgi:predicted GIY-YIG superfamily endonuclease
MSVLTLRERPTWVYRLADEEESLLYVGVAVHLENRLLQHKYTKHWWSEVVFVDTERYPTRRQALDVELHYIKTERPLHNIAGQPPEIARPHDPIGRLHLVNMDGVLRHQGQQGLVS